MDLRFDPFADEYEPKLQGPIEAEDPGTIYLIHFDKPYKHAKHYCGWTMDLESRLDLHRRGQGSKLMAVAMKAGITGTVVRTWKGSRSDERKLKNRGSLCRVCPICRKQRTTFA